MAKVRQRGTTPELAARQILIAHGLRVRTNGIKLPGSPDLFTLNPKRAVFVHGCFWHRHNKCPATTTPKAHRPFWLEKFDANVFRDQRKTRELRSLGYRVMTIWECQFKSAKKFDRAERRLIRFFAT